MSNDEGTKGQPTPGGRITRRRFLYTIGAVGGAGAVLGSLEALGLVPSASDHKQAFQPPRTSDFHLKGRVNSTSVLILGGGDAGLASAYELEKAGYRCEILEARSRPGGRAWTIRGGEHYTDLDGNSQTAGFANGQYMNAGPARIPQHHTTLDYCRELRVPIEVFINANPEALIYRQQASGASGPLTGQPIKRRAAKADYTGYVSELLAKSTHQGALDDALDAVDKEALITYLRSVGVLGPHDKYVGSADRGWSHVPGAALDVGEVDPPYAMSDLLASGLGSTFEFEEEWDQAMPMFQPIGGMDRIAYALAAAVRGPIRYESEVRKITTGSDRVDVEYIDAEGAAHRTSADYCICTIPPMVLSKIDANFTTEVVASLASMQPMSVGKMGLQFSRRFWEEDLGILGGITDTNLDITTIWYPSYGFHGDRGILIGYYMFADTSDRFAAMSPRARQQSAVQQGVAIHGPVYRSAFETAFSVHWQRVKYSEAGWALIGDRSSFSPYGILLQPVRRLYFAGDHLSQVTAWQHGAFESARYVVTQLHQRVLAQAGQH